MKTSWERAFLFCIVSVEHEKQRHFIEVGRQQRRGWLKDLLVALRVCSGQIHQEERMASGIHTAHTRSLKRILAESTSASQKPKLLKKNMRR